MKATKLKINYSYEFSLIGISSPVRLSKITHYINKKLEMEFARKDKDDIIDDFNFPQCEYIDNDYKQVFFLLDNYHENNILIPEYKKEANFLLIIFDSTDSKLKEILTSLNEISVLTSAFIIDVDTLKSKNRLLEIQHIKN